MSTIAKQYQLNYFDPAENSNKVWIGKAYSDGKFETHFGRVRENGLGMMQRQKQLSNESAAVSYLEAKRNEKIKKGYRDTAVVENSATISKSITSKTDLSKLAVSQIEGATDTTTAELIKYLAEVNIHNITHSTSIKYDASNATFRTPLGILTPEAISEARKLLSDISRANQSALVSGWRATLVSDYFRLVPKDFGSRIPQLSQLLETGDKIREQNNILDALESAIVVPVSDSNKLFKCKLTKLPHWTEDGRAKFREIKHLYEKTLNKGHQTAKLSLKRVYEVEIADMKSAFDETAKKLGNVRTDLWHGTKASNLLSILKQGLIIPPQNSAHCTGRMFGNGIYTSLQSTKALNYATDFWNGSGKKNQKTFMFLTEVALGKMEKPKIRNGNFPRPKSNSTWVEPGTCGVMNHEAIVYQTNQINLKYLCEFGAV